jgi:hypothetical protein
LERRLAVAERQLRIGLKIDLRRKYWLLMKQHSRFRIICLALVLLLALSSCASMASPAVRTQKRGQAPQTDESAKGPHAAALLASDAKPIADSGLLRMYFDDTTKTVIVQEKSTETVFYSVGQTTTPAEANKSASAVAITVLANGRKIALNSQDHSVAYNTVTVEAIKKDDTDVGIAVDYKIFLNAETAVKKNLSKKDIAFLVSVRYTLEDGNFYADAAWKNLSKNPDASIESIGLLERFGALRNPTTDDYLFLPDGCGALLYPAIQSDADSASAIETQPLQFIVYGEDPSNPLPSGTDGVTTRDGNGAVLRAHVPAFGIKRGKCAFLAFIEKGAALATITAEQQVSGAADGQSISTVGARFLVTPNQTIDEKNIAVAAEGYPPEETADRQGGIRLCYRFFFGDNANYATMAVACREELIRTGQLSSTKTVEDDTQRLPIQLNLLATTVKGASGVKTLTTFDQIYDLATRLKGKGVDAMNIRILGALTGGIRQKEPEKAKPLARLNRNNGFADLQAYCTSKGLGLYLDVNLYPAAKNQAASLLSKPLERSLADTEDASVILRDTDTFTDAVRGALKRLDAVDMKGISVGDAGNFVYADYAGDVTNREQAAAAIARYMPALSARWSVMLNVGNIYAIRTADVIVNLPLSAQITMPSEGRYEAIPFLQMILHGSVDYAGTALNLSADAEEALLKTIEYGAMPSFTWYATQQNNEDDAAMYFEPQINDAVEAYVQATNTLGNLRGQRIARHTTKLPGLRVTEYANGAKVYVNYNTTDQTADGITIPARSFFRVD